MIQQETIENRGEKSQKKLKWFTGAAAEQLARVSTTQTYKMDEAIKARKERPKFLLPQIRLSLKEPKPCSFPKKKGTRKLLGQKHRLQLRRIVCEHVGS